MKYRNQNFVMIRSLRSQVTREFMEKLEALYIHTLEDLIALWEIEGLGDLLADNLDMGREELDGLVDSLAARSTVLHHSLTLLDPVKESEWRKWHFGLEAGSGGKRDSRDSLPPGTEGDKGFSVPKGLSLVSRANLAPGLRPIKDQGGRGTCVAFGTNAVREYLVGGEKGPELSEQFLYWGIKMRDGNPNRAGSRIRYAVQCMEEAGVCEARTWPYCPQQKDSEHQGPPPDGAAEEARKYVIMKGIPLTENPVESTKAVLCGWNGFQARPVSFGIPVFESWRRNPITFRMGRIPMPLPGESPVGGHCMTLVGYQDDASWPGGGYFILRNSWGTAWASECEYGEGYGTIPYAFIRDHLWGAWTLEAERIEKKPMKTSFFTKKTVLAGVLIGLAVVALFLAKRHSQTSEPGEPPPVTAGMAEPAALPPGGGETALEQMEAVTLTGDESAPQEEKPADVDLAGEESVGGELDQDDASLGLEPVPGPASGELREETGASGGEPKAIRTLEEEAWARLLGQTPAPENLATYPHGDCFAREAEASGVPVALALGMACQVSNFVPEASMDRGTGIMNVNREAFENPEDAWDPCANIARGCGILAGLMRASGGAVLPAVAAYRRQLGSLHTELIDTADVDFSARLRIRVEEILAGPYQERSLTPWYAFEGRQAAENNLMAWEKLSGQELWLGQRGEWFVLHLVNDQDGSGIAAMKAATGLAPFLP
ncbi:MAG: C1 family peptidase [Pseudomonadota bacterium]